MAKETKKDRPQQCPKCGNHCPVDALQCGKGRKYFGTKEEEKNEKRHDHRPDRPEDGLAALLHRCGRFVRHSGLGEAELFQDLTGEEQAGLQAALEKLSAGWQTRFGEDALSRHPDKKPHHKHKNHDK